LDGKGAFDGIDDTAEFHQRAVADQLDHAALVRGNRRIEYGFSMVLQARQRAGFIGAHHAGIADDISRKHGGQAPVGLVFGHNRVVWDICQPHQRGASTRRGRRCRIWVKDGRRWRNSLCSCLATYCGFRAKAALVRCQLLHDELVYRAHAGAVGKYRGR
jgi:hypothetical protein